MMKSRPLSPPILNNEEQLQTGFQHLVPNNSSTSFSRGPFSYEDSVQRPRLLYGSPPTIYQEDLGHQIQQPMYTYPNKSPGRRLQYNALPQYSPETVQYGIPQSELQAVSLRFPSSNHEALMNVRVNLLLRQDHHLPIRCPLLVAMRFVQEVVWR